MLTVERRRAMKRTILLCVGAACLAGCAFVHKMDATQKAIDAGRIEGLSLPSDAYMDFTTWSWPDKALGPYCKIAGFQGHAHRGTNDGPTYVFYLGKSRERKKWEVFAAMVWEDGKWKPVAVKSPGDRSQ